jgi:hypothetical protein
MFERTLLNCNCIISGHRTHEHVAECHSEVQPTCCGGKPADLDTQRCPNHSIDGVCRKGKFHLSEDLVMLSFT